MSKTAKISCKTCKRGACAYAGIKTRKRQPELENRASTCPTGYKAGPGPVNPPGHNMTEATHLEGFVSPSVVELSKAAKQNAFLKR